MRKEQSEVIGKKLLPLLLLTFRFCSKVHPFNLHLVLKVPFYIAFSLPVDKILCD